MNKYGLSLTETQLRIIYWQLQDMDTGDLSDEEEVEVAEVQEMIKAFLSIE